MATVIEPTAADTTIELVPLARLFAAEDNPRRDVGDVTELAASIKAVGLLEPLVVTPRDGGYLVVCGARRLAAAAKAGLDTVPAIVREFDEPTRQEAMLVENLQRENLTAFEEADAFQRLLELGYTQKKLGERVGRSQSHISKRLALLKLPAKVRKQVDSGGMTLAEAVELAKLAEHPDRMKKVLSESAWLPIARAVDNELRALERERKVAAAIEEAKATGIRYVDLKRDGTGWTELPKGIAAVESGSWDGVDMAPSKHAKEPCHAISVDPRSAERIYLCTDPARHAGSPGARKVQQTSAADKRGARRREHEKKLKEGAKARLEFIREKLLPSRIPKPELLEQIVHGYLRAANQEPKKIACRLLGIEPIRRKTEYSTFVEVDGPLADYAMQSEAHLLRVGLALTLAGTEQFLSPGAWHTWTKDKPYFEFLARHGYPTPSAEKLELAGKAPSR